eukprot:PhF_6_TR7877/c0_g1_i1/m.11545
MKSRSSFSKSQSPNTSHTTNTRNNNVSKTSQSPNNTRLDQTSSAVLPQVDAATPIYHNAPTHVGQQLDPNAVYDLGIATDRFFDLMTFPPSPCGEKAHNSVQAVEGFCALRDFHLGKLEQARDALQEHSLRIQAAYQKDRLGLSEDDAAQRKSTLDALGLIRTLHDVVDEHYQKYAYYQKKVKEARKQILLAFDESLSVNVEVQQFTRAAERAAKAKQKSQQYHQASLEYQMNQLSTSSDALDEEHPLDVHVHGVHGMVNNLMNMGAMKISPTQPIPNTRLTPITLLRIIVRAQSQWRRARAQRKFRKIQAFREKVYRNKLNNHLHSWYRYCRAVKHRNRFLMRSTFGGLLGFANIKILRRNLAVNRLVRVQQDCTVSRVFSWWTRYSRYMRAPIEPLSGARSIHFQRSHVVNDDDWETFVSAEVRERTVRDRAMNWNLGASKHTSFKKWVIYTRRRRLKKERLYMAKCHAQFKMLTRHFTGWHQLTQLRTFINATNLETKRYFFLALRRAVFRRLMDTKLFQRVLVARKCRCWLVWRRCFQRRTLINTATLIRVAQRRRVALTALYAWQGNQIKFKYLRMWTQWKLMVSRRRLWRRFVGVYWMDQSQRLKQNCFRAWRKAAGDIKREKDGLGPGREDFESFTSERFTHNVTEYQHELRRHKEDEATMQVHACTNLLYEYDDGSSPNAQVATEADETSSRRSSVVFAASRAYNVTETTVYKNEVPIAIAAEIRNNRSLHEEAYHSWNDVISSLGDRRMTTKILFLLMYYYYNIYNAETMSSRYHVSTTPSTSEKPADDKHTSANATAIEEELANLTPQAKKLLAQIDKAKCILMSIAPEFYDAQKGIVNVKEAMTFIKEQQLRNQILVAKEQKRDKRLLCKIDARLASAWLNYYNPAFTITPLHEKLDVSVWDLMYPKSDKKRRGAGGGPSIIPPPLPKKKWLKYLLRQHMFTYLSGPHLQNVSWRHSIRIRVARALYIIDYVGAALEKINNPTTDAYAKRHRLCQRTTFLTIKAIDRKEQGVVFDRVTGRLDTILTPQDREKWKHLRQFSVLDFVGFNPLHVPTGKEITGGKIAKKKAPERKDSQKILVHLTLLSQKSARRLKFQQETKGRYSEYFKSKGDLNKSKSTVKLNLSMLDESKVAPFTAIGATENVGGSQPPTARVKSALRPSPPIDSDTLDDSELLPTSFTALHDGRDAFLGVEDENHPEHQTSDTLHEETFAVPPVDLSRFEKSKDGGEAPVVVVDGIEAVASFDMDLDGFSGSGSDFDPEYDGVKEANDAQLNDPAPGIEEVTPSVDHVQNELERAKQKQSRKDVQKEKKPKDQEVIPAPRDHTEEGKQKQGHKGKDKDKDKQHALNKESPRREAKSPRDTAKEDKKGPKDKAVNKKEKNINNEETTEPQKRQDLPTKEQRKNSESKKSPSQEGKRKKSLPLVTIAEGDQQVRSALKNANSSSPTKGKVDTSKGDDISRNTTNASFTSKSSDKTQGSSRPVSVKIKDEQGVEDPLVSQTSGEFKADRRTSLSKFTKQMTLSMSNSFHRKFHEVMTLTHENDEALKQAKLSKVKTLNDDLDVDTFTPKPFSPSPSEISERKSARDDKTKKKKKHSPTRPAASSKKTPEPLVEIKPKRTGTPAGAPSMVERMRQQAEEARRLKELKAQQHQEEREQLEAEVKGTRFPQRKVESFSPWRMDERSHLPAMEALLDVSVRYNDMMNQKTRNEIHKLQSVLEDYMTRNDVLHPEIIKRQTRETRMEAAVIRIQNVHASTLGSGVLEDSTSSQHKTLKESFPKPKGKVSEPIQPKVENHVLPPSKPPPPNPKSILTGKLGIVYDDDYPTKPVPAVLHVRLPLASSSPLPARPESRQGGYDTSTTVGRSANTSTLSQSQDHPQQPQPRAATPEMTATLEMVQRAPRNVNNTSFYSEQLSRPVISVKNSIVFPPKTLSSPHVVPRDNPRPWSTNTLPSPSERSGKGEQGQSPHKKQQPNPPNGPCDDDVAWTLWFEEMEKLMRKDPEEFKDIVVARHRTLQRQIAHAYALPSDGGGKALIQNFSYRCCQLEDILNQCDSYVAEHEVMQIVGNRPLSRGYYPEKTRARVLKAQQPLFEVPPSSQEVSRIIEKAISEDINLL